MVRLGRIPGILLTLGGIALVSVAVGSGVLFSARGSGLLPKSNRSAATALAHRQTATTTPQPAATTTTAPAAPPDGSGGHGVGVPPPPTTTTTAPPAPQSGCDAALAYLRANANPQFTLECPGNAFGREAMTCAYRAGFCPGYAVIAIADPCPAAYMNEASNSWVLMGLRSGSIDPYGAC